MGYRHRRSLYGLCKLMTSDKQYTFWNDPSEYLLGVKCKSFFGFAGPVNTRADFPVSSGDGNTPVLRKPRNNRRKSNP